MKTYFLHTLVRPLIGDQPPHLVDLDACVNVREDNAARLVSLTDADGKDWSEWFEEHATPAQRRALFEDADEQMRVDHDQEEMRADASRTLKNARLASL